MAHFLIQAYVPYCPVCFHLLSALKINVKEMSLYGSFEGVDCRRVFDVKGQFVPKSRTSDTERA